MNSSEWQQCAPFGVGHGAGSGARVNLHHHGHRNQRVTAQEDENAYPETELHIVDINALTVLEVLWHGVGELAVAELRKVKERKAHKATLKMSSSSVTSMIAPRKVNAPASVSRNANKT